jgi:hypothetical protein
VAERGSRAWAHGRSLAIPSAPGGTGGLWGERRYDSGMNPTVTGALIAGGAALVGFAASVWQNSRTIRASNRSAREQRLWDRKAALYEEIIGRIRELEDVESAADLEEVIESLRGLRAGMLLYAPDLVADRFSKFMYDVRAQTMPLETLEERLRNVETGTASLLMDALRADVQQRPRTRTAADALSYRVRLLNHRFVKTSLHRRRTARLERLVARAQLQRDAADWQSDDQDASDLP